MMARQGQNFVIPSRWVKLFGALLAVGAAAGPMLGVGVAYIVRDTTQENRITQLEKQYDRIEQRLDRIESLLMERK